MRRAAKKGGAGCRKGQPSKAPFSAAQFNVQPAGPPLMCNPPASPVVQSAGPLCAAHQPADNSCFSFGNTALQPAHPAGPPFSVIPKGEV